MRRAVSAIALGALALTACTGSDDESAPTTPATSAPSTLAPTTSSSSTSTSSSTTTTTDVLSLLRPVAPPPPEDCGPDVVCTAGWLVDPAPLEPSLGLPIDDFRHSVAALGVITRVVEFNGVPEPGQIAQDPPEAPYTEVRQEGEDVVGFVDVPWSLDEADVPTELVYVLHRVLPMEELQFKRLTEELGFTSRVGARTTSREDGLVEQSISTFGDEPSDPWRLTIAVRDGIVEHISEAG